jgi:hypothetical protein
MDESAIVEDAAQVAGGITFHFRQPDGTMLQERGGQEAVKEAKPE